MELVQGCAVSAAGVAAVADVWTRRIPNWLTFGTLILGVLLNTWLHAFEGALAALAGAALGLALLLPFYALGMIGAGDVKLLAALGALIGPQALVSVAVYGAIAGGLMSVVILGLNGRLLGSLNSMLVRRQLPSRSGATAPYAVAIAAGVVLSVMLPGVLR
jgi:prepilin peptidase CpaA